MKLPRIFDSGKSKRVTLAVTALLPLIFLSPTLLANPEVEIDTGLPENETFKAVVAILSILGVLLISRSFRNVIDDNHGESGYDYRRSLVIALLFFPSFISAQLPAYNPNFQAPYASNGKQLKGMSIMLDSAGSTYYDQFFSTLSRSQEWDFVTWQASQIDRAIERGWSPFCGCIPYQYASILEKQRKLLEYTYTQMRPFVQHWYNQALVKPIGEGRVQLCMRSDTLNYDKYQINPVWDPEGYFLMRTTTFGGSREEMERIWRLYLEVNQERKNRDLPPLSKDRLLAIFKPVLTRDSR
ncbi:MAG: hypothetical protein AAFP92_30415 [Bacteroidota bacterium]